MCMYVCVVFLQVHVYMCGCGSPKLTLVVLFVGSPLYALRQSLLLNLRVHQCSRDPDTATGPGIIGGCHACSVCMRVLGKQAPFLVHEQQMLYTLNHFLIPKKYFSKRYLSCYLTHSQSCLNIIVWIVSAILL